MPVLWRSANVQGRGQKNQSRILGAERVRIRSFSHDLKSNIQVRKTLHGGRFVGHGGGGVKNEN
jgi:hypothetical protein